ncbi:MAG: DUF362 domain-containing protein [Candidatus Aenigmarchaeota archaeon]|nr:DUF362 domain-containing protein [Candidatus Aenigmarchaeota archaeon]
MESLTYVYLQKTKDRKRFVEKFLERKVEKFAKAERVLVKPNIVSYESYPTTTHPATLEACLEFLSYFGKEILVADGPAVDAGDSNKIIESHPLKSICNLYGVEFLDLSDKEMKRVKTQNFELELSTIPFNYDFIISLPVLKSHGVCGLTGALKNQYGFLSPKDKVVLHGKNIHLAIAELNQVIKPNLYIVDAVQTLINTNERRHGGEPKELGYMLGGEDPVSLDVAGFGLLKQVEPKFEGKSYEDILHLKYAIDLGVGTKNFYISNL